MTLYKAGWIAVIIEAIILLIWLYAAFGSRNGTDTAGRGLATVYILALAAYMVLGIILMLINNKYCSIAVIVMAVIPLLVVFYGLVRYLS